MGVGLVVGLLPVALLPTVRDVLVRGELLLNGFQLRDQERR